MKSIKSINILDKGFLSLTMHLEGLNILINWTKYLVKRRFYPNNYLSKIKVGKFPTTRKTFTFLPRGPVTAFVIVFLTLVFFTITDISLKQLLLKNFKINIDGVGNLGLLGATGWGILATVLSVGLATLGIILQTLTQEPSSYKRKFLLYHFFDRQKLKNKIFYSMLILIVTGLLLVFKEKLLFYPFWSEHIYFVFFLIVVFILLFTSLMISSFNYLFPEKQDEYFGQELKDHLSKLINKSGQGLVLIDYLEEQLKPVGIGVRYLYDENERKNQNIAIIETKQRGSIFDVDLMLLKRISKILRNVYIEQQRNEKPLKAELYIEYGRLENREYQPLARLNKQLYTPQIDRLFKQAIILSSKSAYNLDEQITEYLEWVWGKVLDDLEKEKITSEQSNLRLLYDFFENALRIFSEYKKKYEIEEGTTIDKWEHFNNIRRQYYIILEAAYQKNKVADSLFHLNYAPFAFMQRAIYVRNFTQFALMSEMVEWIYRKIDQFEHPRKKNLKDNFLLSTRQFGDFNILGTSENFNDNFKKNKEYLDAYLTMLINLMHRAVIINDREVMNYLHQSVFEYSKHASYKQKRVTDYIEDGLEDNEKSSPAKEIGTIWRALILRLQSWTVQQHKNYKLGEETTKYAFNLYKWNGLEEILESLLEAIGNNMDEMLMWHKWDMENESILEENSSFGGFDNQVCVGATLQAIRLLFTISEDQVKTLKRLIKDDSYFNLLISDNGTMSNILQNLEQNCEEYFYLFDENDRNIEMIKESIKKFREYLQLTIKENANAHVQKIISATLDDDKLNVFKQEFLSGYNSTTTIRKILKESNKIILELTTNHKPFFGNQILIQKEAFIKDTPIDYGGIARNYGEGFAATEDYVIIESLLDNKKINGEKLFNKVNVKEKLDQYIATLSKEDLPNTIIFLLSSFSLQETITRSEDFQCNREQPRPYIGIYKGLKVYSSNFGNKKGIVVFDTNKSITVKQFSPDIEGGEMIGSDKHISYLVATLSDNEVQEIHEKNKRTLDEIKTNVRLRYLSCITITVDSEEKVFKIEIQTED